MRTYNLILAFALSLTACGSIHFPSDPAASDAAAADAAATDAAAADAEATDAAAADAGQSDASLPDAGESDGGAPDTSLPDAGGCAPPAALVDPSPTAWSGRAFPTLQEALACIRDEDARCIDMHEIWLRSGRYFPDETEDGDTDDPELTFNLPAGVALYGGFRGDECDRSERDAETNLTVLSGDITQDDHVDADGVTVSYDDAAGTNSAHVITIAPTETEARTTVIDGITITAGMSTTHGGGIQCDAEPAAQCNLEVAGVRLMGNQVVADGPELTDFGALADSPSGGALYIRQGAVRLSNVLIHGGYAWAGGAIMQKAGTLRADRLEISSNEARYAVTALRDTSVTLTATDVRDNRAYVSSGLHFEGSLAALDWEGGVCERNSGEYLGACLAFHAEDAFGPLSLDTGPLPATRAYWEDRPNDLMLRDVQVLENEFTGSYGTAGITIQQAKVAFERVLAARNVDRGVPRSHHRRGVLWMGSGNLAIIDSRFEHNVGGHSGVFTLGAVDTRLERDVFVGNSGTGNPGFGVGQIWGTWSDELPVVIKDCVFDGNSSGRAPILSIVYAAGPVLIVSSTFRANQTMADFGIVSYLDPPEARIENSVFVGNVVSSGPSAVLFNGPQSSIVGCTFAANQSSDGPTVLVRANPGPEMRTARIDNSILWDSDAGAAVFVDANTPPTDLTISHSIVLDGAAGVALETVDAATVTYEASNRAEAPLFVDLSGADGVVGTDDDDLHLMAGSPGVDLGDVAVLPADSADLDHDMDTAEILPLDRTGEARVLGASVDCGAFESF